MDQLGQWLWFSIDFIFVLRIKVNPHLKFHPGILLGPKLEHKADKMREIVAMLGWLTPICLVMHALKTKAFFG